jgi:hypothetical protein
MFTALRAMFRDPTGRIILEWAAAQITLGTVVYMWLEGWSPVDALYFSVVALATVGFGDLHPTTDIAKLFTVVYIIFGLGVIAAFISEITKYRASTIVRRLPRHGDPVDAIADRSAPDPTPSGSTASDEGRS